MLQRSIVSKGDVGLFDSQFLAKRGPRCEAMWLTIPQSAGQFAPKMSKVACHRRLLGGLEVVKCAKR